MRLSDQNPEMMVIAKTREIRQEGVNYGPRPKILEELLSSLILVGYLL